MKVLWCTLKSKKKKMYLKSVNCIIDGEGLIRPIEGGGEPFTLTQCSLDFVLELSREDFFTVIQYSKV